MPINFAQDNTLQHFITRTNQGSFDKWVSARIGRLSDKVDFERCAQNISKADKAKLVNDIINNVQNQQQQEYVQRQQQYVQQQQHQ